METIDMRLQDHIIFGYPDCLSMKDCGLLAHILNEEHTVMETAAGAEMQSGGKIVRIKTLFGKGQIKSARLAFFESKRRRRQSNGD